MILYFQIFILIIFSYEFIKFLKLIKKFKNVIYLYKKIFKILVSKKISDNWKEKVLLKYSLNLFIVSAKIILIISSLILFFYILEYCSNGLIEYTLSYSGIIQISIFFLIYHYLKILYAKL